MTNCECLLWVGSKHSEGATIAENNGALTCPLQNLFRGICASFMYNIYRQEQN